MCAEILDDLRGHDVVESRIISQEMETNVARCQVPAHTIRTDRIKHPNAGDLFSGQPTQETTTIAAVANHEDLHLLSSIEKLRCVEERIKPIRDSMSAEVQKHALSLGYAQFAPRSLSKSLGRQAIYNCWWNNIDLPSPMGMNGLNDSLTLNHHSRCRRGVLARSIQK